MGLCCSIVKKCTEPQNGEREDDEEAPKPHVPPEIHNVKPVIVEPEGQPSLASGDEFRPRSASDPHNSGTRPLKPNMKSQTPSLGNIPEETATTSSNLQQPPCSPRVSMISMSSSPSMSSYRTPLCTPLSKHNDHQQPIRKDEAESEVVKRNTVLSKHTVPQEHIHFYHTLIERLEKAEKDNTELREMIEQERMKQHTELMNVISGLTKRVQELETEKCREKQETATPDKEELIKNTASQLPQNCSVSTKVLVGLAKHVTQWKFLARRLHLQESDIQQIEANYSSDIREQSYQMLLKWKLTCSNASYHTLGEAVREEFGATLYCDYVEMVREAEGSSCQ